MINQNEIGSSLASIGMVALADYVSSPSSTGSWMFYDIPELLVSTGGRTQTQVVEADDDGVGFNTRLLWIKKPYRS